MQVAEVDWCITIDCFYEYEKSICSNVFEHISDHWIQSSILDHIMHVWSSMAIFQVVVAE